MNTQNIDFNSPFIVTGDKTEGLEDGYYWVNFDPTEDWEIAQLKTMHAGDYRQWLVSGHDVDACMMEPEFIDTRRIVQQSTHGKIVQWLITEDGEPLKVGEIPLNLTSEEVYDLPAHAFVRQFERIRKAYMKGLEEKRARHK